MATTLLTGGTGFIGSHLARALLARGDQLRVLTRRSSDLSALDGLEFERAVGSVTDRRAVRNAMDGVARVFHVAGRTSLRKADREAVFDTNVRGSRIIFESALEAGVERVVHTSSSGAIGVAKPKGAIDETASFDIGYLGITYVNSKHEAEFEALRAAAKGLDVVIVNPTFVLGPDDPTRTSMGLVRRFCLGQIPAYVGGALNIVDVRDVATGHLLADEKGSSAERYILSGRNFTLDRLFADLSRISGIDPPAVKLPKSVAVHGAVAAQRVGLRLGSPEEVLSASLWWTYRNTKAKRELGFKPRPHEQTLEDAVEWQLAELGSRRGGGSAGAAVRAAGKVLRR
jgi:dihydroflavonol-4-reductase